MHKNMNSLVAVFTLIIATVIPAQSFGAPVSSPGNTQGNGPCATSGSTNSQTQSTKNPNKSCYEVGKPGPGGGIVFYYNASGFTCGPTLANICHYLEAAPTTGPSAWTDATYTWLRRLGYAIGTTSTAIGSGYKNTLAMIADDNRPGQAGTISRAYRGPNNLTDWYLPSQDELNQMCKWAFGLTWESDATPCNGRGGGLVIQGFVEGDYWSSTEADAANAWAQSFLFGLPTLQFGATVFPVYVRPVRAF